jgi:hypothetical protein
MNRHCKRRPQDIFTRRANAANQSDEVIVVKDIVAMKERRTTRLMFQRPIDRIFL